MKLSELLENAKAQFDISRGNDEITEIIYDSRTESPDKSGLFICIKGFAFDSHDGIKSNKPTGLYPLSDLGSSSST